MPLFSISFYTIQVSIITQTTMYLAEVRNLFLENKLAKQNIDKVLQIKEKNISLILFIHNDNIKER